MNSSVNVVNLDEIEGNVFAGRAFVLDKFIQLIQSSNLVELSNIDVAVIGGSRKEFEIQVLELLGLKISTTVFNLAGEFDQFIDLNEYSTKLTEKTYDLVLCSQVLEHIHNIHNAIINLKQLTKSDGYLFLNVPFSNMVHRDSISEFYTPGYSSKFLSSNFDSKEYEIIESVDFGTRRLYNFIHLLQVWPLLQEHNNPLKFGIRSNTNLKLLRYIFQLRYIRCFFWNSKLEFNSQFSTESIILVHKY